MSNDDHDVVAEKDGLTPVQIVDNQYDAFLASESLDPAWVAGWHAAIRHASYALDRHARGVPNG